MTRVAILATIAAVLPCLPAQTVGSPITTYVFDSRSASIRPLIGVAGSSFLGDPVATGLQFAVVAPNGVSAITVAEDGVEWIADLGNYPRSGAMIGGALADTDQIFWDSHSSAVVMFSANEGQMQFLSLAGGTPALQNAVPSDWCPGSLAVLAADPVNAIAAVTCGQNLFFLQPNVAAQPVQTPDVPVAAAFAEDGSFYVGGAQSNISRVANPAAGGVAQVLFQEPNAPNAAAAILVQSGKKLLYTADGVQWRIRVYDLSSFTKIDELPLYWQPTQFQPFFSNSFLVNTSSKSTDPLILLQTDPRRSVLFIPAGE